MTADYGLDAGDLPIGRDRTIMCLQRRIRLLEAALTMANQIMRDQPFADVYQKYTAEISKILGDQIK